MVGSITKSWLELLTKEKIAKLVEERRKTPKEAYISLEDAAKE